MTKYLICVILLIGSFCSAAEKGDRENIPPPSFPYITHWIRNADGITFGFQTTPPHQYIVEGSTDLKNWYVLTNFVADKMAFSMTIAPDSFATSKNQYFRFKVFQRH